jgi:chromosome segregation and condensation protein ScpB
MISKKYNKDWMAVAQAVRAAMVNEQPPVTIEKVMETMGYASKNSADYALHKLQELGAVKWIDGKWYLV